ncbi:MAG: GNAT family N-acetyltransferase [Bryobacteraceae bacterium]|nr:GNAT family N-acetyltransferase [Bryobacteraceae bacterium]
MPLPELRTDRLILIPVRAGDTDRLRELWSNADVRRYLFDDVICTLERAREIVGDSLQNESRHHLGLWCVHAAGTGALAGFAGFFYSDCWEVLYGLLPEYWGQGLATEAAAAVIAYAFDNRLLDSVTARADAPNGKSFGVMERLGMARVEDSGSLICYRLDRRP